MCGFKPSFKRITIFAGHYGSGKTTLSINYALALKKRMPEAPVAVCDLDIVNPYFRTADYEAVLSEHNIELIAPEFARSNLEIPAIPAAAQKIFDNKSLYAVIDLGGDDRGALALGRYAQRLMEDDYEMLLVANKFRPLSSEAKDLAEIKNEIESAAHVKFTGIVNNSNLGGQTTPEDITGSAAFIQRLSRETGLSIKMTAVSAAPPGTPRGWPRITPPGWDEGFFIINTNLGGYNI